MRHDCSLARSYKSIALSRFIGDWTFQPPTIQPPTFQPPTIQPPTFQPPIKADLPRLTPILQRMKFNLLYLFARALSVESYYITNNLILFAT